MTKRVKMLVAAGVLGLVVALGAVGVSGVFAQSSGTTASGQQSFISRLAQILGIDEQKVRDAAVQASTDQIDSAVTSGKLSQDQANKLKQNLDQNQGSFDLQFGPGGHGFGFGGGRGFGRGFEIGNMGIMKTVTDTLGISQQDLMTELQSGKTLAQIATEHGKTAGDLKTAITAAIKSQLDQAVAANKLTADKETQILNQLSTKLDKMLNQTWNMRGGKHVAPNPAPNATPNNGGTSGGTQGGPNFWHRHNSASGPSV